MENGSIFIGLDVHKATIAVAVAMEGRSTEVRYHGVIAHKAGAMADYAKRLGAQHPGHSLSFVYEAGGCGYGLARELTDTGHECMVIAPSLIPMRAGDRIKTDRRDSVTLAKMHRAGELISIWTPDTEHEAMRDLVRAREAAMHWRNKARQALSAFLLRQGFRYGGKTAWGTSYWRWLATLKFEHAAQQAVFEEYIIAIREGDARHDRLVQQIEARVAGWSLAPLVEALQAMRGIALITAASLVAEVGDFARFATPRHLMAYLGLVPAQHSSGSHIRHRGITKSGNARIRRLLVESAWTYCRPPRVNGHLLRRQENLAQPIRTIGWKAQQRLHERYRRLAATGKAKNIVITAIAREMVGFIWAISREVEPRLQAA